MTGRGQRMPAAVELSRRHRRLRRRAVPSLGRPDAGDHLGEHVEEPSTCAAVVSRCSETRTLPWVSTPIAASTWLGRQRRRRARRAGRHAEPAPVELGHQRLAVDVQAGERHQVGEPVVRVADHLDVGHLRGHPRADPVDQRVLPGGRPGSRSSVHRLQRGRGGQGRRDVLEARRHARRPGRRRGTGCATGRPCGPAARRRRPARPTCAPSPRRRTSRPAGAGGPCEAQASTNSGTSPQAGGDLVDRLDACRPRGWRTARRRRRPARRRPRRRGAPRRAHPPGPVHRRPYDRRRAATRSSRVQHRRVLDRAVHDGASRHAGGPRARPSRPRWTAWVPDGVKVTSSGRTPRHAGDHLAGVVEQQAGVAAPVRAGGAGRRTPRRGRPGGPRGPPGAAARTMRRRGSRRRRDGALREAPRRPISHTPNLPGAPERAHSGDRRSDSVRPYP